MAKTLSAATRVLNVAVGAGATVYSDEYRIGNVEEVVFEADALPAGVTATVQVKLTEDDVWRGKGSLRAGENRIKLSAERLRLKAENTGGAPANMDIWVYPR